MWFPALCQVKRKEGEAERHSGVNYLPFLGSQETLLIRVSSGLSSSFFFFLVSSELAKAVYIPQSKKGKIVLALLTSSCFSKCWGVLVMNLQMTQHLASKSSFHWMGGCVSARVFVWHFLGLEFGSHQYENNNPNSFIFHNNVLLAILVSNFYISIKCLKDDLHPLLIPPSTVGMVRFWECSKILKRWWLLCSPSDLWKQNFYPLVRRRLQFPICFVMPFGCSIQ